MFHIAEFQVRKVKGRRAVKYFCCLLCLRFLSSEVRKAGSRRWKEKEPLSVFVAHYVFDFQFLRSEGRKAEVRKANNLVHRGFEFLTLEFQG